MNKIVITSEGSKWHLQVYSIDDYGYEYQEEASIYCDSIEESLDKVRELTDEN
jgi:hypothetical protein